LVLDVNGTVQIKTLIFVRKTSSSSPLKEGKGVSLGLLL